MDKLKGTQKRLVESLKFTTLLAITSAVIGISSYHLGAYQERKQFLINQKIKGEQINLEIGESNRLYRTLDQKLYRLIDGLLIGDFGQKLAEKRFKAGEFNRVIEKYRSHNLESI